MAAPHQSREFGGADPIDAEVGLPADTILHRIGLGRLAPVLHTRPALGLRPSLAPAILLLPLGFLLGPHAFDIVTVEAIAYLDTVVAVALAVLGVFVGLALAPHIRAHGRLIAAASLEAAVTMAVVSGAVWWVIAQSGVPIGTSALLVACCAGICSAASSGNAAASSTPDAAAAAAIADLDDVLPILLSALVMFFARSIAFDSGIASLAAAPAIGLAIAAAGWLLFERAESAAERGALLLGSLALLGGATVYLSTSPLVAGFVAGLFWKLAPGRADLVVETELRSVQHPLVVLLLIAAGAMCVPSLAAAWLLVPYVLFRIVGKLAGASIAARVGMAGERRPSELGALLISPGVFGVAFALAFAPLLPVETGDLLVTVVAAGSIISEIAGFYVTPPAAERT